MNKAEKSLLVSLIRHGEKRFFASDLGLTELGQKQALTLGQDLAQQFQINSAQYQLNNYRLLASPKRRTQETAQILAKKLQLTSHIDPFLDVEHQLSINRSKQQSWLKHFQAQRLKQPTLRHILAVTHSQNIRYYWHLLGGPAVAIKDIEECGIWTINIESKNWHFIDGVGEIN